jgi:hypothetical protein
MKTGQLPDFWNLARGRPAGCLEPPGGAHPGNMIRFDYLVISRRWYRDTILSLSLLVPA